MGKGAVIIASEDAVSTKRVRRQVLVAPEGCRLLRQKM
jgi:hypothetical protein